MLTGLRIVLGFITLLGLSLYTYALITDNFTLLPTRHSSLVVPLFFQGLTN